MLKKIFYFITITLFSLIFVIPSMIISVLFTSVVKFGQFFYKLFIDKDRVNPEDLSWKIPMTDLFSALSKSIKEVCKSSL